MSKIMGVRLNSDSILSNSLIDSTTGVVGTFSGYPIQTVDIRPGDAILVHISDDLHLDECQSIYQMMCKEFPNNTILLSNEHVLKGMTILRNSEQIDNKVSIKTEVDLDKFFDEIMKGYENDFLH